jgi:tRNA(Ile)-lysidine synthase
MDQIQQKSLILGMLEKFQSQLAEKLPFLGGKKLLLAVSGGIDSMVMLDLLHKSGYSVAIAHCNFQLRGVESVGDEKFVRDYAAQYELPIFITHFDTKTFADDYKLSTQMAARELRYNWFYELLESENFDYLLTAHHADDNLETFLINLSRGTGLDGLTGIPQQNDRILRPLVDFHRSEIEAYAQSNKIEWREDSSNASDGYLRNKIRHHIVPLLKELNPDFLSAFQKTQHYLQQSQDLADDAAVMVYQQVAQEADGEIHFNLKKLKQLPNYHSYLYQWLREFGFSAWDDIYRLADGQSGKQIFAPNYRLLKNREFFILSPLKVSDTTGEFYIEKDTEDVNFPLKLSICKTADISDGSNSTIFVDEEKLDFPLLLRRWKDGDVFQPAGMDGQSKKVGKFFKDEKLSLIEKENTWLLCTGNQIVWIVGLRQDERFKATHTTKQILKIAFTP